MTLSDATHLPALARRDFPAELHGRCATSSGQIEGAAAEDGRGGSIGDRFRATLYHGHRPLALQDEGGWLEGYARRFGSTLVDHATQRRSPKANGPCRASFLHC